MVDGRVEEPAEAFTPGISPDKWCHTHRTGSFVVGGAECLV